MAGSILVSEENGVSMSGVAFRHLVEVARSHIERRLPTKFQEVYGSYDDGGLEIISAQALDVEEFNRFVDAVDAAYREDLQSTPAPRFSKAWEEVLAALNGDPRRNRAGI